MIHRDIKSQNVMLTRDLKVKLIDFGLAMHVSEDNDDNNDDNHHSNDDDDDEASNTVSISNINRPEGTYQYMAPELFVQSPKSRKYSTRSDIWAFGVVLVTAPSERISIVFVIFVCLLVGAYCA
jgi:serine/threonine protein kinase